MSLKQWDKYKKKLVEPKDYIILDASGDDSTKLQGFVNVVTVSDIVMPPRLISLVKDEDFDDIIDETEVRELEKSFFGSLKYRTTALAIIRGAVSGNDAYDSKDVNAFIVLQDDAFKFWYGKYRKTFIDLIPSVEDFVYTLPVAKKKKDKDEVKKDVKRILNLLDQEIPQKIRKQILRDVKDLEKELEEEHKEKKKKKKDKKKKLKGFGFDDWD